MESARHSYSNLVFGDDGLQAVNAPNINSSADKGLNMQFRKTGLVAALLVCLGVFICVLLRCRFALHKEVEEDISKDIEAAAHSDPIQSSVIEAPLDYFRPQESISGRLIFKVSSVEFRGFDIHGTEGKIDAKMYYEQYYIDGTVDEKADAFELYVEEIDGVWKVQDVRIPL